MKMETSDTEFLSKSSNICSIPLDCTKIRLSRVYLSIYKNHFLTPKLFLFSLTWLDWR